MCEVSDDVLAVIGNSDMNEDAIAALISDIEYFKANKINLSKATTEDVATLPMINYALSARILDTITTYNIKSIRQLFPKIEMEEIQKYVLINCTYIENANDKSADKKNYLYIRHLTNLPLQQNAGIAEGKFAGSNIALTNTIMCSIYDYRIGVNFDKDIGESKINDFYSFFAEKKFGNHKIILGSYKISSSQGLVYGSGFPMSKYYTVTDFDDDLSNKILPDLSTVNYKSLRGAAYCSDNYAIGDYNLNAQIFISSQKRSATLNDSGDITSLYTANLFRTSTEINKKDNIYENAAGTILGLSNGNLRIIYSALQIELNKEFASDKNYGNRQSSSFLHSLGIAYTYNNVRITNELALNKLNLAEQLNISVNLDKISALLSYRYYSSDFYSPLGLNKYQFANVNNETGFSSGWEYKFSKKYKLSFATDYFESLSRTYFNYLPIKGIDIEMRNYIELNTKSNINISMLYKNTDDQFTDADKSKRTYKKQQAKCRIEHYLQINDKFTIRSRAEIDYMPKNQNYSKSLGMFIGSEMNYNIQSKTIIKLAAAGYNTDDFNTCVYYYNSFFNYGGSIKPLYGKGTFCKIDIKYELWGVVYLAAQYQINYKFNETKLSSGYGEINSNYEHYLKCAAEVKI